MILLIAELTGVCWRAQDTEYEKFSGARQLEKSRLSLK